MYSFGAGFLNPTNVMGTNLTKKTETNNGSVIHFGGIEHESFNTVNTTLPLDALPPPVSELLILVHNTYGKSIEYSFAGLLGVVSTLVGATTNGKVGTYTSPAALWIAVIGETGTGKTPALDFWADYIRDKDRKEYAARKTEWEQAGAQGLFQPPLTLLTDATIEGLANSIDNNKRGIFWYADELATLIRGLDKYSNSSGSNRGELLNIWNGKQAQIIRASKSTIQLINPRVTILGGLQPKYTNLITDGSDGWFQRFLIFPDRIQEADLFPDVPESMEQKCQNKRDSLLSSINDIALFDDPVTIKATAAAKDYYIEWHNKTRSKEVVNDTVLSQLTAKLTNYCIRLAVNLQALSYASEAGSITEIDFTTMERAVKLTDWFRENALSLYDSAAAPELKLKQGTNEYRLWQALSEHSDFETKQAVKLYIKCTGANPTKSTEKAVNRALTELVAKGVLKKVKQGFYAKQ